MTLKPPPSPRSVERVLDVLEFLAHRRHGASLGAISRLLDIPKASLSTLTASMRQRSYILRAENGTLQLGSAAFAFARMVTAPVVLVDLAHPFLEELAKNAGETVLIATLMPDDMVAVYIDKAESENPIRYTVPVGLKRELHAAAAGKVLLAFQDADFRAAYVDRGLEHFTDSTITAPDALERHLEEIRNQGFAFTEQDRTMGANAIAAPIWGADGELMASLTLAGPTNRMQQQFESLVDQVLETTRKISERINGENKKNSKHHNDKP